MIDGVFVREAGGVLKTSDGNKNEIKPGNKADNSAGAEEVRRVRRNRGMLWIPLNGGCGR